MPSPMPQILKTNARKPARRHRQPLRRQSREQAQSPLARRCTQIPSPARHLTSARRQDRRPRCAPDASRRHTIPQLARRDHPARVQHRQSRQLAARAHSAPPANRRARLQANPRLQRDRPKHHIAPVKVRQAQRRVLPQRHAIAKRQQIPPAARHINAAMDMHPLTNPRAQPAQDADLQARALDQRPWDQMASLHHDPMAQIPPAPHGHAHRRIAPDQQAFERHCQSDCARRIGHKAANRDQWRGQHQAHSAQMRIDAWEQPKRHEPAQPARDQNLSRQPADLHDIGQDRPRRADPCDRQFSGRRTIGIV